MSALSPNVLSLSSASSVTFDLDASDTLSAFLAVYQSPAAVLDACHDVPVQGNGPYIALRQQYPGLVSIIQSNFKEGNKRFTTAHEGRVVRWTITAHPVEFRHRRAILLGQDERNEGSAYSACERCLSPSRGSRSDTQSPRPASHTSDASATPLQSFTTPPSSTHPNPIHLLSQRVGVPAALPLASTQAWLKEPRFRGLATGKGIVGEVVRTLDWSKTSLGPIDTWPAELVHTFGTILHCQSPSSIIWGKHHSFLYNTAYISLLGPEKHPHALGQPTEIVWPEVWPAVSECVARTIAGEDFLFEDHQILIRRPFAGDGEVMSSLEDAYFTHTFIPVYLADGAVGGVYNPVVETTIKARSERRWSGLCGLATRLASSRTTLGMLSDMCDVLRLLDKDISYVAAYTAPARKMSTDNGFDASSHLPVTFTLRNTVGLTMGSSAAPIELVVDPDGQTIRGAPSAWPIDLRSVVCQHSMSLHTGVACLLQEVPLRGSVPHHSTHAATLPIVSGDKLIGFLVVYIGPGQPIDARLNDFLDLLMRQLSTSASMVAGYELEATKLEEMAALDRAKTSFFTNISHELRTPLTLILGPVRELSRKKLSTAVHNQLSIVERNADRLLRLVTTIMDFASAEAGRMTSTFRPTYLGQFTANLASAFQSGAQLAGLGYKVDTSPLPFGLVVWVDQDKYEKIVYNLLSNALKYTLAGFVSVSTYLDSESGRFVLEVRDTGVGIPSGELEHVFERFHRVASTQGRSIEGTGIGLTYVLELVKMHKGEITVDSEPTRGSIFRVLLPLGNDHLPSESLMEVTPNDGPATLAIDRSTLDDDDDPAAAIISTAPAIRTEKAEPDDIIWQHLRFGSRLRARVIVADDNPDMRQYVVGLLQKYCDVLSCEDGAHALAELRAKPHDYDLVLSDDLMPNMTGPELLSIVRAEESTRTMPFIIVSANAGDGARMDGLALGADDYISKPFQARELLLRVHTQLQSASIRSRLQLQMDEQMRCLEESRESFTRLCERLQVGIHRSDPEGRMIWANRKWKSAVAPPTVESYRWGDAIHPADLPGAKRVYDAAMQTKTGFSESIEFRLRVGSTNDSWIDVVYDLQPEFAANKSGDLLGWVGVWSDVSNLRRLQREAVKAERAHTQEAERSRELQEQFIDITCHELRNPLNAIYNSAAMLGESLVKIDTRLASKAEQYSDFEMIHAEIQEDLDSANTIVLCARHQKRIVDDVLNVSKLSAGLVTINSVDFSPCQEVKNTVRMFRDEVAARGVHLQLEEDKSMRALQIDLVRGDSSRFVQVIVNLLSNAIKFTGSAPHPIIRVRIGATEVPEGTDAGWTTVMDHQDLLPMCRSPNSRSGLSQLRLYIAVADSGLGMTEQEQSCLFQRFAQANPRTYGEFGGSGLGLYVSRMLVELQGGKIHLQSQQGVGSIFQFYIVVERSTAGLMPLMTPPNELPSITTKDSLLEPPPAEHLRVLVVEDNKINQRILVKLLKSLGCDTRTCDDGQECVDLLESLGKAEITHDSRFDLILMDLEMPVLDGLGATRKIRQLEADGVLTPAVPIVAVSGNARSDRAREAGMNGFVRKPYGKTELAHVIDTWRQHTKRTGTGV